MKPFVKNLLTGEIAAAETRRLSLGDIDSLLALQDRALDAQNGPGLCTAVTPDGFRRILELGEIHGLFAEGNLCGACGLFIPGSGDDNLSRDAGLTEKQAASSATLRGCFVAPEYRRNGIARELAGTCMRAAEERGVEYVLCAVSPRDFAGLAAMMSINGMTVRALRLKGGRLRYILCRERKPSKLYTVYERSPLCDVYAISRALADGRRGISLFKDGEDLFLWLAK